MKEFELHGDISSGFRWSIKGATDVKREAFVPLGDSSGLRIQSNGKRRLPSGTAIAFDLDYDLLLASAREARKQLLAPWAMLPLVPLQKIGLGKFVDPYYARELHLQELRDEELRDVLNTLFGKSGDWRVALCVEARRNDHAWGELKHAMAGQDETREVDRFLEAFRALNRLKERGPVKVAKAWALFFVLGCRARGEPLPTRGEVLRFLASRGIEVSKNHAARDIFTGPILSALPRGGAGRPRKTRRARRE